MALRSWLDSITRDVGFGIRMLRKQALVTGAAVASLALALGACVAAFSLVDALILRPLPVRQPDRLIYLTFPTYTPERPESEAFTDPLFAGLRDAVRDAVDLFAMSTQVLRPVVIAAGGEKEQVRTQHVSGDAFDRLGVRPSLGRLFTAQDDVRPGDHPVAVISHSFWTRRFGGDTGVVGRTVTLEGKPYQIVGVTESRFSGVEPGRPTDLWVPYAMYNPHAFGNWSFSWFRVMGRIRDRVTAAQATSALQAASAAVRRTRPKTAAPDPSPEAVARFMNTPLNVRPAANGPSPLRRQFERSLWILASIALLVLLIAGSNVANLFLARTAAREREMALRLSIGAGRSRLIQQVLVESALLAMTASALGVLVARVTAPAVVDMLAPAGDPVDLELALDWRLVAVAGGLTLAVTALFGLASAVRASRTAPWTALRASGGRATVHTRVMRPFLAVQTAFGLTVLFVGGLLVLSFVRLASVNPGFATGDVLRLSVEAVQTQDPEARRTAVFDLLDRLRRVPGVRAASAAEFNALGRAWTYIFRPLRNPQASLETTIAPVATDYFETMDVPVLAGRSFDRAESSAAVVVNQAFAMRYFGGEHALGRTFDANFDDGVVRHEVVGIVRDTKYDLREDAAPTLYIPLRRSGTILVRAAADALALAPRLRQEIGAAGSPFRVTSISTQAASVDETMIRERLLAVLAGFFAIVGVVLVAVGLYGGLSYAVVQRTREIGIRVALGAPQLGVARTVLMDTGITVLVGACGGLAAGLYLARFVRTLLFEVRPFDTWSLALPTATFLVAAVVAATLPALRVTRVDPVVALRYD